MLVLVSEAFLPLTRPFLANRIRDLLMGETLWKQVIVRKFGVVEGSYCSRGVRGAMRWACGGLLDGWEDFRRRSYIIMVMA